MPEDAVELPNLRFDLELAKRDNVRQVEWGWCSITYRHPGSSGFVLVGADRESQLSQSVAPESSHRPWVPGPD